MTQPPAQAPKSILGRHRLLAPTAGVYVSPICLGAMNFGNAWSGLLGECSKETAFELLDYFHSMGGNFVDTANNYQDGESEEWLGEWMALRDRRDEMVIATKYTSGAKRHGGDDFQSSNFGGNSSKSLHISVRQSLKRLKTDYIDLLYVHYFDFSTGIPEMMRSLHHLVASRQVLYLGISDTPAWIVVEANCFARQHGLTPFSVYQGRWSAAQRDFEREIIPMCEYEGMGMAPWGTLGGGYFISPNQNKTEGRTLRVHTGKEAEVSIVLDRIAKRKGTLITSIALAYILHKAPYVFPICGGRKVSHLRSNIEALSLELSGEEMEEIETAYDFQVGFPHDFIRGKNAVPRGPQDVMFTERRGQFDHVERLGPIKPAHPPTSSFSSAATVETVTEPVMTVPSEAITVSQEEATVSSEAIAPTLEPATVLTEPVTITSEPVTVPAEPVTVPAETITVPSEATTVPPEAVLISPEPTDVVPMAVTTVERVNGEIDKEKLAAERGGS